MRTSDAPGARRKGKILLLCLAAFAAGALGISFIPASRHAPAFQPTARFDFGPHRNLDWSGPKAGDRLDLQRFAGRGGERITDSIEGDILMLATVDPDCAAAAAARDQLRDVRDHIAQARVPYLLVSVTNARSSDEFFKYVDSLGVDSPAFLWESGEVSPPESFFTMVVPSHILLRWDGTILRTWPGTSQSKRIRFQMVNQIIADALGIATSQR